MNYFTSFNPLKHLFGGLIVDFRTSVESVHTLKSFGIKVFKSTKLNSVSEAVCGHTDIQIHNLGNNRLLCAPEVYDYYKSMLPCVDLIKGSQKLTTKYPGDILYNAAAFGDYLICNTAYTAKEILSEYVSLKKKILNVKQGYAKCSICIIDSNAIITSDMGIHKTAIKNDIDSLLIEPGFIELYEGMNGFIGGASGLIAPNILAINGNIKTHKNCNDIIAFCKNRHVDVVSLNNDNIVDIGSIIPVF